MQKETTTAVVLYDGPLDETPARAGLSVAVRLVLLALALLAVADAVPAASSREAEAATVLAGPVPESLAPGYQSGDEIVAGLLADVPDGETAGVFRAASVQMWIERDGREVPDMWLDALDHPVGVKALRDGVAASVLWLARVTYTETNRVSEYADVMWVVRNRVDNGFGGEGHYRTVILDRAQFSHFNSEHGRTEMDGYGYDRDNRRFQAAIELAYDVVTATDAEAAARRPFSGSVMHYYSSVSMKTSYGTYCWRKHSAAETARLGVGHPKWAHDGPVAHTAKDADRFRFIEM